MNQDEELDRLERCLQLFLKRPVRDRREGITVAKLGAYVTALREYDAAKEALAANPNDSEMIEKARIAGEVLDHARNELRH